MSQFVETNTKSFRAGGAIGQYLRVKLTAGLLALAGIADREIGTMESSSFASGEPKAVRLRTACGTIKMVANGAITQGANVFTAASGKISATAGSTSYLIGQALEAAGADGDVIEVLRNSHGDTATP